MARPLSTRAAPALRKPGRPSQATNQTLDALSREAILERATQLARDEPLEDLSIVRLARAFGVTPALIHYYVGSRDDLISGVVNRYFKARVELLQAPTGDWRSDLTRFARTTFAQMVEYGGVVRYIALHNRHRLFQKVAEGEIDYGVEFFDSVGRIFQAGGFTPAQGALGYHLLALFLVNSAYAEVARLVPGAHRSYIDAKLQGIDRRRYPGAHFMGRPFARLDSTQVLAGGLRALLDAFERWPRRRVRVNARQTRPSAAKRIG